MRICPYCSTENEAFFRFCLGCGADLDEVVSAEEPSPPVAVSVPKPPALADTVTDVPPVAPRAAAPRVSSPALARPTSPPRPAAARFVESAAAKVAPHTAEVEADVVPKPTTDRAVRPSEDEPRPIDRAKTFDGGQAKIANPALHAVGQAQIELAKRQPVSVSAREEKAEGPTKRGGSSPELMPPTARDKRGEPTTQPRAVDSRKKPEAQKPPSRARLVVILEDGTDGAVLELLPQTTIIGREGVDISFPHDDFLARRHAEFSFSGDALFLRPLESTNGVFVQVHHEVELETGDVFRIGQQLLSFEMLSQVAADLEEDPRGQAIPLGSPIPEGAWGRLGQLIAPDTLGSVYLLGGTEVYLGRERGDITFPGDGFVSGLHAQISMRGAGASVRAGAASQRCFLKDLGSSNGTYLRLTEAVQVTKGTLVLAGQQLFRVDM